MGDTYSNLNLGHYNREAMAAIDSIVDEMLVTTVVEQMESVDGSESYGCACALMQRERFDVLGVTDEGRVIGYVPSIGCDRSPDTPCRVIARESADDFGQSTVAPSFKLFEALLKLAQRQRLFVSNRETGDVEGIVTRADLQKAPIRMIVFAYVTVFEIHLTQLIRDYYPGDSWEGRVVPPIVPSDGERDDYHARAETGEETDLLDCLSFSKKVRIVRRTRALVSALEAPGVDINRLLRSITQLRNAVAHGSSLANRNRRWADVAALVRDVKAVNSFVEGRNEDIPFASMGRGPSA